MNQSLFCSLTSIAVECIEVADHLAVLLDEERALAARAVPKRQREFSSGRLAAHHLFDRAGEPRRPILTDDKRAPIWPTGWVGSISHTASHAAAALARRGLIRALGIDIEKRGRLTQKLLRMILTPTEIEECAGGADLDKALLIFSAKEAIYKAVQPIVGGYIGFQDVAISVGNSRFSPRQVGKRDLGGLIESGEGHFETTAELVASLFFVKQI